MILVSHTPLRGVQNILPMRASIRTREKNYTGFVVTAQELKAIHERSVISHDQGPGNAMSKVLAY